MRHLIFISLSVFATACAGTLSPKTAHVASTVRLTGSSELAVAILNDAATVQGWTIEDDGASGRTFAASSPEAVVDGTRVRERWLFWIEAHTVSVERIIEHNYG